MNIRVPIFLRLKIEAYQSMKNLIQDMNTQTYVGIKEFKKENTILAKHKKIRLIMYLFEKNMSNSRFINLR